MAVVKKRADGEGGGNAALAPERPMATGPLPAAIKLVRPHGFIDEAGNHRYWQQDQVVFEPADIKVLMERGAEFVPAELSKGA